jgi:Restriction endonuclease NaeI
MTSAYSEGGRDVELEAVVRELLGRDPTGELYASVYRETFDQLYDGQRTGRYRWEDLFEIEKTHYGTLDEKPSTQVRVRGWHRCQQLNRKLGPGRRATASFRLENTIRPGLPTGSGTVFELSELAFGREGSLLVRCTRARAGSRCFVRYLSIDHLGES